MGNRYILNLASLMWHKLVVSKLRLALKVSHKFSSFRKIRQICLDFIRSESNWRREEIGRGRKG